MTDDKQHDATTELNEALAAGFSAGNFDGVGAFYTEATRLMPPRGKFLEGRSAVGAFWLGVANRFSSVVFTTVDLKPLGDTVRRETGSYTMGHAADPVAAEGRPGVSGKYLFVWQLVDGEWQIESSIWNRTDGGAGRQQGRGQGQGQRQGGGQGQGRGGQRAGAGGGYRAGGAQGSGPGGGYRQAGGQGGGHGGGQGGGQGGGYRQGNRRPSFQGGGGAGAGGPRRGGGGQQGGGGYGGGGAGGNLYDGDTGLYANPKG